ncbi:hypothetical protein F4782DRAFT_517653 [Xylaria castorea]|nr:hypothetical protein F4782DRAFT_517653 [Xylaria castorea]
MEDLDKELFEGNLYLASYWREKVENTNESKYNRKPYSPGTEFLMNMVEASWFKFCDTVLGKDGAQVYPEITFRLTVNFLDWCICQRTGRNGQAKKPISKRSTLVTIWCTFRIALERATTLRINDVFDCRRIGNMTTIWDDALALLLPWSSIVALKNLCRRSSWMRSSPRYRPSWRH